MQCKYKSWACDIAGTHLFKRGCISWLVCRYIVVRIGTLKGMSPPMGYGWASCEAPARSAIKLIVDQNYGKASRVEAKRRSAIKLPVEKKTKKARVQAERLARASSQAATIRLIDNRHSYATRSTTVADRAISNVLVLGWDLNIVQHLSDPGIISARTARSSREVQSDARQREAARARVFSRQQAT